MRSILLILLCFLSSLSHAVGHDDKNKAIYGKDNRMDMHRTNERIRHWGTGIATWVDIMFPFVDGQKLHLDFPSLERDKKLCSDERFAKQPTTRNSCTGFLVGPDLLLTAAHCMLDNPGTARNQITNKCQNFDWLFDYNYNNKSNNPLTGLKDSLVRCEKVIYGSYSPHGDKTDFALVKLNQKFESRFIFKFSEEEIYEGKRIMILGHPAGLPLKYGGDAFIKKVNEDKTYFEGTLDAVGGNSGSPVMNRSGEVLGILVRGNDDFIKDKNKNCRRWNNCSRDGSNCDDGKQEEGYDAGMHIQKITPALKKLILENS